MRRVMLASISFGTLVVWSLSACGAPPEAKPNTPGTATEARPTVGEILEWLPVNTETLVVSRGPFKLESIDEDETEKALPLPLEKLFQRACLGPILEVRNGVIVKSLAGRNVSLAVAGSTRFRSPKGLGSSLYDGCHIIVFEKNLGPADSSPMKLLKRHATKVQDIRGRHVFMFEEKWEEDLWKIFIVRAGPNLLLCATDQKYLEEVLQRRERKGRGRAFPDLPEWKQLDQKSPCWAIRHRDKSAAKSLDDSGCFGILAELGAAGLAFSHDPGKDRKINIKYLSSDQRAFNVVKGFAKDYWASEDLKPKVQKGAGGVIEATMDFGKSKDAAYSFLFVLLIELGHGVAV